MLALPSQIDWHYHVDSASNFQNGHIPSPQIAKNKTIFWPPKLASSLQGTCTVDGTIAGARSFNPGRWIVELFNISKRPNYAQQVFGPKAMCKRDPPPLARPPHPKIDAQGAPVAKCKALLHGLANHAFEKTPKSPNTVLTTIPCGC